eukprot:jgi/Mesvir1/19314/Mv25207-RA.1
MKSFVQGRGSKRKNCAVVLVEKGKMELGLFPSVPTFGTQLLKKRGGALRRGGRHHRAPRRRSLLPKTVPRAPENTTSYLINDRRCSIAEPLAMVSFPDSEDGEHRVSPFNTLDESVLPFDPWGSFEGKIKRAHFPQADQPACLSAEACTLVESDPDRSSLSGEVQDFELQDERTPGSAGPGVGDEALSDLQSLEEQNHELRERLLAIEQELSRLRGCPEVGLGRNRNFCSVGGSQGIFAV